MTEGMISIDRGSVRRGVPSRIVVTGAAGFIGSHFVEMALRNGINVTAYDNFTYAGNRENLAIAERGAERWTIPMVGTGRMDVVEADIGDPEAMASAMDSADAVFNFAAESHVDRSIAGVDAFIRTNLAGTSNILECARRLGWGAYGNKAHALVLQVSTDEVYGSIDRGSFTEDSPLAPRNPYAVTKAAAELMCRAYRETHGVPSIVTRGSNTYGPRQYPEKIIPIFATRLLHGGNVTLFEGGENNVRDWLYVTDHCAGIMHAFLHGESGGTYNVAGHCERTNMELTGVILKTLGLGRDRIGWIPDRPGHDFRYSIASHKLEGLGWSRTHGEHDWEKMVGHVVRWYKKNENWWKDHVEW
jgi:dTDP-glucose 4,6-dehydratase